MEGTRIQAGNLACRRGERLLFAGASFALGAGEAMQLIGPNGIGKTSLIRIVAGLLRPFEGTVERNGSLGLVDERPALDEHPPLGKALAFWGGIDGGGFLAKESVADRLGLSDLLDVPVRYLSTGQRKRAALARLLGQPAETWLLDEPLNGLDAGGIEMVEALVADHRAAGGSVIVASHQPIALPDALTIDLREFAA